MPARAEKVRMSSILPKGFRKKIGRLLERVLPLPWVDALFRFWVQTRLLFSKTLLLMLIGLFVLFSWATIEQGTFKEQQVYEHLVLQSIGLAILLHMALWDTERERRTFELLVMRIPSEHRLIWLKLGVSLLWNFILLLPFFIGYTWFVTIPVERALVYLFFCMSMALFVALLTCVISSFVHRGLAAGIIAAIIMVFLIGLLENIPYNNYLNLVMCPYLENSGDFRKLRYLITNRLLLLGVSGLLYSWFYNRLKKTDRWVI